MRFIRLRGVCTWKSQINYYLLKSKVFEFLGQHIREMLTQWEKIRNFMLEVALAQIVLIQK